MKKYFVIWTAFIFISCADLTPEESLINGAWNIQRIEQNGNDIIDLPKLDGTDFFNMPLSFFMDLKDNSFRIEIDPYKEEYIWGKIFLEGSNENLTINITTSNNTKLIGKYEVEIDTLKANQTSDTFKIYLLSDKNTLITAIKKRENPFLK